MISAVEGEECQGAGSDSSDPSETFAQGLGHGGDTRLRGWLALMRGDEPF